MEKISLVIFFDLCLCFEVSFIVDSLRPLHLRKKKKGLCYLEGMRVDGKLIRHMGKKNYVYFLEKRKSLF